MADTETNDQPEVFSVYAVHHHRTGKQVHREVINIGRIEIQPKSRRLTGHFHCTPTGGWQWDFFGVPFGAPPPEIGPERPGQSEPQQADG